jgi:hypothetical protein
MLETLLGGLLGGLFRLAPEVLKIFDRKNERAHELSMQDKALEYEKVKGSQKMNEIGAQAQADWNVGSLQALRDAISAQGTLTGIGWVDALSSSVRPIITYWFMALYCAAKAATFAAIFHSSGDWMVAAHATWTEADMALWAGIINFWFLGRVLDKAK